MSTLYTLSEKLVKLATERGITVGTAESLTAGLISATIADVPGASKVLMGGIVSYDPRVKHHLLNVSQDVIDGPGVVSEPCARQMAEGARFALHADIAVSATGVAGPAGGTLETPVGTVFIGCATSRFTEVEQHRFTGNRRMVREQTVTRALEIVLQAIEA